VLAIGRRAPKEECSDAERHYESVAIFRLGGTPNLNMFADFFYICTAWIIRPAKQDLIEIYHGLVGQEFLKPRGYADEELEIAEEIDFQIWI
jgi:hypothetical protein